MQGEDRGRRGRNDSTQMRMPNKRLQFPMKRKIRSLVTILWIGLFAGTLDIADNLIFNQLRGITPKMVFQYIASGLIGTQASRGDGLLSVALGVGIHLHHRTHLDGRVLCGKPQACDPGPAACSKRLSLWLRHIHVHEFHRPAPLWSSTSKERGHNCFKGQRCPGSSVLHWITYLASRAQGLSQGLRSKPYTQRKRKQYSLTKCRSQRLPCAIHSMLILTSLPRPFATCACRSCS
jgi:hypothetical protein